MTIEFFTGFEGCASGADVFALFDGYSYISYSSTGGYNDSKCLAGSTSTIGYAYRNYVTKSVSAGKTKAVGLHVKKINSSYSENYELLQFIGPNVRINNGASGLALYVNNVFVSYFHLDMTSNIWLHTEYELFSDAAAGYFKMKINGELVCDMTGINTGGADITAIKFGSSGSNGTNRDNIYIADALQGELYSYLLQPASDSSVQFTPSTGTDNYSLLSSNDGDTTYVESSTVGHKDLYGYEDLPTGLIPVAIMTSTIARREGTGATVFQVVSKQDSVEYDESAEINMITTYPDSNTNQAILNTRSVAPDGTAWTREKINALQFGFKVVA